MSNKYESLRVEGTFAKEQRNRAISDALGSNKEVAEEVLLTEYKRDRDGNPIVDRNGNMVVKRKKLAKRFGMGVMKVAGPGRETQAAKRARLKDAASKKVRDITSHRSCGNVGCTQCNPVQNMRLVTVSSKGKQRATLVPLLAGNPQAR